MMKESYTRKPGEGHEKLSEIPGAASAHAERYTQIRTTSHHKVTVGALNPPSRTVQVEIKALQEFQHVENRN